MYDEGCAYGEQQAALVIAQFKDAPKTNELAAAIAALTADNFVQHFPV